MNCVFNNCNNTACAFFSATPTRIGFYNLEFRVKTMASQSTDGVYVLESVV